MNRLITIVFLTFSLAGITQESVFEIGENINLILKEEVVEVDTTQIHLYKIQINNSSDSQTLFWFSEIDKTNLSNKELIHNHFFKTKGDFNLFQIATETISSDTKIPFNSLSFFTKVIDQSSSFQYNIIVKNQNTKEIRKSILRLINKQIILIPVEDIKEMINIESLERILYKSNSAMIYWKILNDKIIN
jgi:hypothetical protein